MALYHIPICISVNQRWKLIFFANQCNGTEPDQLKTRTTAIRNNLQRGHGLIYKHLIASKVCPQFSSQKALSQSPCYNYTKAKKSNTIIPEPDGLDWAFVFSNEPDMGPIH